MNAKEQLLGVWCDFWFCSLDFRLNVLETPGLIDFLFLMSFLGLGAASFPSDIYKKTACVILYLLVYFVRLLLDHTRTWFDLWLLVFTGVRMVKKSDNFPSRLLEDDCLSDAVSRGFVP